MNLLVNKLLNIYESVRKKDEQLLESLSMFGGIEYCEFLDYEISGLEKAIVLAIGGDEGNYDYLSSTDIFDEYISGEIDRDVLVARIKDAIDNEFKGSIPIEIVY